MTPGSESSAGGIPTMAGAVESLVHVFTYVMEPGAAAAPVRCETLYHTSQSPLRAGPRMRRGRRGDPVSKPSATPASMAAIEPTIAGDWTIVPEPEKFHKKCSANFSLDASARLTFPRSRGRGP